MNGQRRLRGGRGAGAVPLCAAIQPIRIAALLCAAVLAGCATGPAPHGAPPAPTGGEGFTVEDRASIGAGVRADFDRAMAALRAGDYAAGIAQLESVVARAPQAIAPYVNLAMAYEQTGKTDAAEERLQTALRINPEHPVANNEYGIFLRRRGRFEEARKFYEKALDAYPDFHPARKNLGILCDLYLNDLACALANYEAYARAMPADEAVKLWVVDLKNRMGN